MKILTTTAAALALAGTGLAQGGQVQSFGCGLNPDGSLVALGAPTVGGTLAVQAVDAAGTLAPGAIATVLISVDAPLFPCGLPLANLGPGDAPGELLIALGGSLVGAPGTAPLLFPGGATPTIAWAVPDDPALAGFRVYLQALLIEPGGDLYLSNGLAADIGPKGQPNLTVSAVSTDVHLVRPGEVATVAVVIENTGDVASSPTVVETCNEGQKKCGSAQIPSIPPGGTHVAEIFLSWNGFDEITVSNFFTATVDPADGVAESDETDNQGTATKPLFVTDPILVPPLPEPDHDEVFEIVDGQVIAYERTDYPGGAPVFQDVPVDPDKGGVNPANGVLEVPGGGPPQAPKVDPLLAAANAALGDGETIDYLVKYRHQIPMPRLPDLTASQDRFSPENMAALELRVAMFEGVRRARRQDAAELTGLIQGQFGGQVLEHYTLPGTMLVRAPKGLLQALDQHADVLHVERTVEEESQPPDSVADGRALIDTDPYFNGGATGVSFTALLDSGIRSSHDLFNSPDHILFEEDCVNGTSTCADGGSASYDPDDDFWDHGTSSAAILTGNSNLGGDSRGVTSGFLDSWKVYDSVGLDTTAVLRAFDEAVLWGDKVIVAEMQSGQSETGSIAEAADDAFEAGCCVIAANGNNGSAAGTVNSPANAHKAIGVGAYDVDSLANQSYVSRGPTGDDRYKPDLQAPTNTDTASTITDSTINNFGGTSGATPYAAGAASIFADWFGLGALTEVAAGKVYAGLLVGGTNEWDTPFDNEEGVGRFALPLNGRLYTGSRTLSDGDNSYVTINVPSTSDTVEVALWWPEKSGWTHRDIDAYIQRPNGTTSDSSLSVVSVFERVKVNNASSGNRDIRIHAFDVPWLKSQTVYYAIHVH